VSRLSRKSGLVLAASIGGLALAASAHPAEPAKGAGAEKGGAALTAATGAPAENPNRLVRDGVVIDFSLGRVGQASGSLLEGDYAEVRFRMTDATSGRPVPGLKPAAWMDMAGVVGGRPGEVKECKEKVGLYLKGTVGIRPMIDLNSYYLLVLNNDGSISVIDPVVSMTGNTSLYATVILKRPAADWVKSRDEKRLYLAMPRAGEVAAVDAEAFQVAGTVEAGESPTRIALQADGKYLWVGNDTRDAATSGVTVIEVETFKKAAFVPTGKGHHEIAFSADDRYAFVTNRDQGTVSVVEIARLVKVKDLKTGPVPISIAYSPLSQSIYVADGQDGRIAVIDPARLEVATRVAAKPGLGPMRASFDGRWVFVVNPAENAVFVLDASENKLAHTVPVGGKPFQVTLTRAFAYVRLLDSDQVKMVNLLSLEKEKKPTVQSFGAGTGTPRQAGELALADTVSPASSDAAVFVLNPADGNTYFYMEGMNAPMGSFGSYGHRPLAVGVADRSLKEVEPGVYASRLRIPAAGRYDVAILLDNPRVLHCFSAEASPNPSMKREGVSVDWVEFPRKLATGETLLRLKLTDAATRGPRTGVTDLKVAYYAVPGDLRTESVATDVGDGIYEVKMGFPRAGLWYVFVGAKSLRMNYRDQPFRSIVVEDRADSGASHAAGTRG
jgi:YVTN family beta-propeller protein